MKDVASSLLFIVGFGFYRVASSFSAEQVIYETAVGGPDLTDVATGNFNKNENGIEDVVIAMSTGDIGLIRTQVDGMCTFWCLLFPIFLTQNFSRLESNPGLTSGKQ